MPVGYLASAEQGSLNSDIEEFYQNMSDSLDFNL